MWGHCQTDISRPDLSFPGKHHHQSRGFYRTPGEGTQPGWYQGSCCWGGSENGCYGDQGAGFWDGIPVGLWYDRDLHTWHGGLQPEKDHYYICVFLISYYYLFLHIYLTRESACQGNTCQRQVNIIPKEQLLQSHCHDKYSYSEILSLEQTQICYCNVSQLTFSGSYH